MNEIRNSGVNFSTVSLGQVQQISQTSAPKQAVELETLLNKTLGNSPSSSQELSLDVIMSGSLGGYLGLGATALDGLESPIASSQVLSPSYAVADTMMYKPISLTKKDDSVFAMGIPQEIITSELPEETLSSVAFSMEVNEVALGLVPGASFTPGQGSAVASITEKPLNAVEFTAMTNPEKENFVLSALPAETLSEWDSNVAVGERSLGLSLEVPESLSALAFEKGDNFNARPLASVPFIEGRVTSYDAAWTNISETLSAYESSSSSGVLALGDVWGRNSLGYNAPAFSLGLESDKNVMGFENVDNNDNLLGYRSFVSRELLGFIDLSPYSSTIAMNVNPTSVFSSLTPGKYLSSLMYGYSV